MSGEQINVAGQYLTFTLDAEVFATSITRVREVLEFTTVTKVPRAPEFMRGVINLRVNVVPVMDLHARFCSDHAKTTVDSRIVVIELHGEGELQTAEATAIGMIADSVHEVLTIDPEDIQPAPSMGDQRIRRFLKGIARVHDDFLMLLDFNHLFDEADNECIDIKGLKRGGARQEEKEVAVAD